MGRTQAIDGTIYYSPNSREDVSLDPRTTPFSNNPFIKKSANEHVRTYDDFKIARYWSQSFGWISFIPTRPWVRGGGGAILMELATRPSIEQTTNASGEVTGYAIASSCTWPRLEDDIFKAVVTLTRKFHIPCILPAMPHTYGYRSTYSSRSILLTKVNLAREWFMVWLGALGYAIAWLQSPSDSTERVRAGYPEWRSALEAEGLPPWWLDEVLHSPICSFHSANPRAGCIINVLRPILSQPKLDWLVDRGIPVWYPWGTDEEERAKEDTSFAKLQPSDDAPSSNPLHPTATLEIQPNPLTATQLPEALDHLDETSELETPTQRDDDDGPVGAQAEHYEAYAPRVPEWVEHFEKVRQKDADRRGKASERELAQWKSREREPATRGAKVFVWELSDDPLLLFQRNPTPTKWSVDTLLSFSEKQKVYNAIRNEWDCCEAFGEPDEDSDDDDSYSPAKTTPALGSSEASSQTPMASDDTKLQDLDGRPCEMANKETMESAMQAHFHDHHGFCMPIAGTWTAPKVTQRNRKNIFQLGDAVEDANSDAAEPVVTSLMYSALDNLFETIVNRQEPTPGIWDLRESCPHYVRITERFSAIHTVPVPLRTTPNVKETYKSQQRAHYYVFLLKDSSEPWTFATLSASTALMVCRMPRGFKESDIACRFAQSGIPFRIFYPSDALTRRHPRTPKHQPMPMRPFDHVFTKADYNAYVNMRTKLLSQSHMQAALKRGGIAWRLAITTLGINVVTQRPTLYNEFEEISLGKGLFVDDVVTEEELDILCGVYLCVSADGKQRALKSWWPLVRYFEKEECGYNHGYWSERNEIWYTERLRDIEEGADKETGPATYTQWKSRLHGSSAVRRFLGQVEKESRSVIQG
ncbi:hypothetical protein FA13DRAFT_1650836 [Coprinellus micaceus]|uniref:Uncharacterized protein n=1 Tax=Coprinellus micaceus TaxID=71717 RepID=A0A4Y7S4A5_COPMI|nr:hypothetical protein FA13DRAFT_1650836 [Coprinellus micaceus]